MKYKAGNKNKRIKTGEQKGINKTVGWKKTRKHMATS